MSHITRHRYGHATPVRHSGPRQVVGAIGRAVARSAARRAGGYIQSRFNAYVNRPFTAPRRVGSAPPPSSAAPPRRRSAVVEQYQGNPGDSHSGLAIRTICIGDKTWPKLQKNQKAMGRWLYYQNNKILQTLPAGQQSINSVVTAGNTNKLLTSSGTGFGFDQNDTALEQVNPYLTNTGSALLPVVITPLQDMFALLKVEWDFEITNLSAVGSYVDIYIVKCKKATGSNPVASWVAGLATNSLGLASAVYPTAGNFVAGSVGTALDSFPGAQPTESRLFSDFWSVTNKQTLTLTGNGTERINYCLNFGRVVKMTDVRQNNSNGIQYTPGNYVMFYVARGSLVLDKTVPASPVVTFGSPLIAIAIGERSTMCGVSGNGARLDTNVQFAAIAAGATTANQSLLVETDISSSVATATAS